MDKNFLLESASRLKQVSDKTAHEYQVKAEGMVAKMNTMMLERSDIESLVGKYNLSMMQDNHANHARFMASILKNHNPAVLVETVLWVFRAYRSHEFTTSYWAAQLNTWILILKDKLSAECYLEVYPYYEWLQINIPVFVNVSDEKLESENSLH